MIDKQTLIEIFAVLDYLEKNPMPCQNPGCTRRALLPFDNKGQRYFLCMKCHGAGILLQIKKLKEMMQP